MSKFNDFLTEVRTSGIAKNNYFEVVIPLPPKMVGNAQEMQKIQLYCETAALPSLNISTAPIRAFGEPREAPYEKLFDNINMTFYVDNDMMVKYFFDRWFNLIQDKKSKLFGYYNDYISDEISVIVTDRKNSGKYIVKLYECYPKVMGEITLSQNDRDVMRLPISFAFKHWESEQLSNVSVPDSKTKIPDNYFQDFKGFQQTSANILGGINTEIRDTIKKLPNQPKIGDNLNNDVGLINL